MRPVVRHSVAFLDGVDGTEQNGADLVTVKVLGKAEDGLTGIGALELQKLACHGALEAGDTRDAVAYLVRPLKPHAYRPSRRGS